MAVPAIVWRNPNPIQRRRVWTYVRRDPSRSVYLVVESASAKRNLEIIHCGAAAPASEALKNQCRPSGT